MQDIHISIVTTLYRSATFLDEFIAKCYASLESIDCKEFEIVVVNDGSPDDSLQKILSLKQKYPHIKVLDFSRNFGHHYALSAGLKFAKGELVFIIDCDLEVDPMVLKEFYTELKNNSCDVVYGYQENRKGKFIEKKMGGLFWKLFNYLSNTKIPQNPATERLMTSQYVKSLLELGDKNIFLAGMMYWAGFKQIGIPISKKLRVGKSTYTVKKRIELSIAAISSFSAYPLKLLFNFGFLLTSLSFLYGFYLIIRKIIKPSIVLVGYTSITILILFSTGIIITSIGILGLYIEKMYNQVKGRPLYIIKNIYE